MWCHSVCAAGWRVAFRRRQLEAAAGEDKKGSLHDTFLCAAGVSGASQTND